MKFMTKEATVPFSKSPIDGNPSNLPPLEPWTLDDAVHWLRLLWPAVLLLICGLTWFREAVVASIVATPHPALVFVIFAIYTVAIATAMMVMHAYLFEAKYAKRWMGMTPPMRAVAFKSEKKLSVFMPVYLLLLGYKSLNASSRQAAVSQEMDAGEIAMEQKLELPNFLGGALVGMGLVGTFIGLLDTLDDLSKVFSALVNTNAKAMSPTQMFTDMVVKLQAPMRGMGTAFVASLYGLLGSLVITLMMVSVRKTAASSVHQIHTAVRQMGYGGEMKAGSPAVSSAPEGGDNVQALKELQTWVELMSKRVEAQTAQHADIAKANSQLIQDLLLTSRAMAANQKNAETTLNAQLSSLKAVFTQERDKQIAANKGVRLDTQKVIQNTEECLASLEKSTRSLRTVLKAYTQDPEPTDR